MNPAPSLAIILNGISRRKDFFYQNILPHLNAEFHTDVFETKSADHALSLAHAASRSNKYQVIFAGGGDGTLNQVINGLMLSESSNRPVVGLIPLGTGNDFARTAGLTTEVRQTISLLKDFNPRYVNIGLITCTDLKGKPATRYFINVADVGMGPVVVQRVEKQRRMFGSSIDYYRAILFAFARYKPVTVNVTSDMWSWSGRLRSLAIANGKYYGHGLCVAPDADPTDDLLNAFICGNVSVIDFARYSTVLKKGRHVKIAEVHYKPCHAVSLTSDDFCLIEGDGEVLGTLPARIELFEEKVKFLF